MAHVAFTPHLRRFLDCQDAEIPAADLRELLTALFAANPKLQSYIVDDQFKLRPHVIIFVDGAPLRDRTAFSDALRPQSDVFIMQALSGG